MVWAACPLPLLLGGRQHPAPNPNPERTILFGGLLSRLLLVKPERIVKLALTGRSQAWIARKAGCSRQYVQQVLKRHQSGRRPYTALLPGELLDRLLGAAVALDVAPTLIIEDALLKILARYPARPLDRDTRDTVE